MSTSRSIFWVLFASLALIGCATPLHVPKLEQQESSGIGISVKIRTPLGWPTEDPHVVYFIKLGDKGDIQQSTVIPSNYAKDGRVYLLNMAPGDYAAVAAWYSPDRGALLEQAITAAGYTTYFPKDLIELTRVSVGKGQLVFAGSYVLTTSVLGDGDPTQLHYRNVISRGIRWLGLIHEAKNDENAKNEFLMRAKEDLAEGGWSVLIR